MSQLTGPKGYPIVGAVRDLQRDPVGFLTQVHAEHGPLAEFRLGPFNVLSVIEPDGIQHVLQTNNRNYRKSIAFERMKPVVGEGLVTSEGDFWRRQRRIAQPAFHRKQIADFADVMVAAADEMLARWSADSVISSGRSFDFHEEMMRLTLSIVCQTMFSTDISADSSEIGIAVDYLIAFIMRRITSLVPLPLTWPLPSNREFAHHLAVLDAAVDGIIRERRQSGHAHNDLLAMLMTAVDEETGEAMSDKQLRDEVTTIFIAGHETTAVALSFAMVEVAQRPALQAALRAEVRGACGENRPKLTDLAALPQTAATMQEAMRLYPPAWIISRDANEADTICGHPVAKDTVVFLSTFVMHRSARLWDNSAEFQPARFIDNSAENRHRFSYVPFGGGPRLCIGNNFAMMEMQLLLARMLQQHTFTLDSSKPFALEPTVTLRPKHGVWVKLDGG